MRLSCAVRAHPHRSDLVADLLTRLGLTSDHVVWDRHNDSWDTGYRAWQAHDPHADWHLVIEDDAVVCHDLLPGLEAALEQVHPLSVVSLYLGGRLWRAPQVPDSASWIRAGSLVWGVAIAAPVLTIPDMLAWCDRQPYDRRVYDTRIARYYATVLEWPALYTRPSLVDHAQVPSLLGKALGRQALAFIGETASALTDYDPTGEAFIADPRRIHKPTGVPMADLLVAKSNTLIQHRGRRVMLRRHQTVADAEADIVREHPNLWEPITVEYPARKHGAVEQATAAPGEKREMDVPGTRKVRDWARANGYEVPGRGKLPAEVVEAYRAAHQG